MALFERYRICKETDDLDQSILHLTEAIFLPLPWDRDRRNIIQIFYVIALALVLRAEESRQPEDVTRSIVNLRYLRGRSLEAFYIPPNRVAGLLMTALGIQVDTKLGDEWQDLEEMAVLCLELLKSDLSTALVTNFIMDLVRAVKARFKRWTEQREPFPDKLIECLREANVRLPDSYDVSMMLAWSLYARFRTAHSNDDYEEGITILDKVIRAPGDAPTQGQKVASMFVTLFAHTRSSTNGKPECLEQAIYRTRILLGETSLEDTFHPTIVYSLALLQGYRFDDSGVARSQEASSGVSNHPHPSFQDLAASLTELNADNQAEHLDAILSIHRSTDGAEVEEAVKYCRFLLSSSHHGSEFALLANMTLGVLLPRAFLYTKKTDYLNEGISVLRGNFSSQGALQADFSLIQRLISSLYVRLNLLHRREDFNEVMQLFPIAANHERARTPDRFKLSCYWARMARISGHPSTSAAYECAISLMQETLTFAPNLDTQHFRLVTMRDDYETLPLDYVSYHISTGQLPQAIETLERGRALIWSEMRGFRTSIDQIHAIDSHLAEAFAEVNRNLEMLTLTPSANSNDDGRGGGLVVMDPFGQLVMHQRKLLDDRNKLTSQIQALPGFGTFLKSPSFNKLHSAAARGPVIIINHCVLRSDILILLHNSSPSLITTADDFYDRASNLRDQLFCARKNGLDSNEYEDALSFVLKELHELVGRPVIERLNELSVPEQSRVWWCPTSVFCSLPLHAMGPIPSDDIYPRYFLDLYIPSYTPTLSTLIESNSPVSNTLDRPSILLVSQPDASLPGAFGETQVVQATRTKVTTLISALATPTTVLERLRDHRFIHIVCHGLLEPGKPFDASFKLYRDERLSLLDIVRSRLPEAEFAFLSACHTAELTEDSISDEGLHLTAAMQYCGFRSVVGTMWAMADEDGRVLARNFYKEVFSGEQGVRYYERTAESLRDAVRVLRGKKRMTLERWVNFVHYGA